jgi:hypothetical protein
MPKSEEHHQAIIQLLRKKPLTTIELEAIFIKDGSQCPDDLARTLNIMRRKGLIKGEVSTERGGWVWWVENKTE